MPRAVVVFSFSACLPNAPAGRTFIGPALGDVTRFGFDMAFPAVFLVMRTGMWKDVAASRPRRLVRSGWLALRCHGRILLGEDGMIDPLNVLTIVMMASVTYMTRVGGYAFLRNRTLSPRRTTILKSAPAAF